MKKKESGLKIMEEMERKELQDRYIRFDWAIKRLLRQKANFDVLDGFLTVMLNEKVRIIEILESEGNQESADDKFNRVDIKALNSKGEIILSLGEGYMKIKKVYSISILYFDIGIGTDYFYHGQNHFIGVHTGDHLRVNTRERNLLVSHLPAEIFPEYILIRVSEFDKVALTPLDEWIEYLKDGTIRPNTTAPGLKEAREKLKYYSMSPQERLAYDNHLDAVMIQNDVIDTAKWEGRIEGHAEGHAEGLVEGETKGMCQVAANMKRMEVDMATIAKYTGLSEELIRSL